MAKGRPILREKKEISEGKLDPERDSGKNGFAYASFGMARKLVFSTSGCTLSLSPIARSQQ
jgi:hypothetical protein